jgi:NAD-dependent DNA ligase
MAKTKITFDLGTVQKAAEWSLLRSLAGKTFCQTGSMSISRDDMQQLIAAVGGTVHTAVKSNTNYLIVPNDPSFRKGSKYNEAVKRGTTVLTEQDFCEMIFPTIDELLGDDNAGSTT